MKANKTFINFSRLTRINNNILKEFNKSMSAKFAKFYIEPEKEEESTEDEAGSNN